MINELCENGLLIRKQATTTKTNLYVMTKFSLAHYRKCTTEQCTSLKLTNQKIWLNIYRMEYILREVFPQIEGKTIRNVEGLLAFMKLHFIDIFRTANQESVLQMYPLFYRRFPVKDKRQDGKLPVGDFADDYLAMVEEYRIYLERFVKDTEKAKKFQGYEKYKQRKELSKVMFTNDDMRRKTDFNLYCMIGQGFFFRCRMEGEKVCIGLFDIYKKLSVEKIYKNSIFILCMLQRYLGFVPEMELTVFVKDSEIKDKLKREESTRGYDYIERTVSDYNKKTDLFMRLGVLPWIDKVNVCYEVYLLEEKYHL